MHSKGIKRYIAAALVLLAGIVVSVVVVGGAAPAQTVTAYSNQNLDSSLSFDSQQVEQGVVNPKTSLEKSIETNNLTDLLVQGYAQNILALNNEGIPETQYSPEQLADLIPEDISYPRFVEYDIIINSHASTEDELVYLTRSNELFTEHLGWITFEQELELVHTALKNGTYNNLHRLNNALAAFITDLLALSVPQQLTTEHLAFLNVLQHKRVLYKAVSDIENDPLKAYLAIQQIVQVAEEDAGVRAALIERYNTLTEND